MASEPLYSVGTYDWELGRYTPQVGLSVPAFNITLAQLRQAFRELRRMGYECYYNRHGNDSSVLVERTDGASEAEILRGWNRRGGGGVIVNQGGSPS